MDEVQFEKKHKQDERKSMKSYKSLIFGLDSFNT